MGTWMKTKIIEERYEITAVARNFVLYNAAWRRMWPRKRGCEICGTAFAEGQSMHLAFVRQRKNMVCCDACLEAAQLHGVPIGGRAETVAAEGA